MRNAKEFTACATLLVLLLAAPVFSQVSPTLTVKPAFAPPQSQVLVSGKNFSPHKGFQISLDGRFIGEGVTNGKGSFSKATARIPSGFTEGDHQLTVTDLEGVTLTIPFVIRTDWTHRRFDIFNTANNPYEWKVNTSNVNGLKLAWNTLGNPGPCGTAIVVAGAIYYLNPTAGLQALDPGTGAPLWNYDMSGSHSNVCGTDPSASDGSPLNSANIYVGADGELWSINLGKRSKNWVKNFGAFGWPLVVSGSVIASNGFDLASFQQSSGKLNYDNTAEADGYLAWSNGYVFSAVNPGEGFDYFRGYNAQTGGVSWTQADVGCWDQNAPLAANENIYKGCGGRLDSFSVFGGSYISNQNVEAVTNLAFANNVIYAGFYQTGNDVAYIGAIDPNTLGVLWQVGLGPSTFGDPIVANGVLYTSIQFGSCSNKSSEAFVLAMDASNGNTLWSYQIPNACSAPVPAAVVDGTLYVVDHTAPALWAFR
jgi:PQQ-like domain